MASGVQVSDDLVFSILSWLPVKSIMRFKCVSKSWYALPSNPSFIAKHLENRRRKSEEHLDMDFDTPFSILVARQYYLHPFPLEPHIGFLSTSNDTMEVPENVFLPVPSSFNFFQVYGPCNGIICLYCRNTREETYPLTRRDIRDVALWNPATREFNLLPASHVSRPRLDHSIRDYGFCFDPKSDDYKVVRVESFYDSQWEHHAYIVEVYSLRNNSWQEIKTTIPMEEPGCIAVTNSPKFPSSLNGVQYWPMEEQILSFDFVKQVFGVIAYPHPHSEQTCLYTDLAVFNDSLAWIFAKISCYTHRYGYDKFEFEIWVLNEERTWNLQVRLGNFIISGETLYFKSLVGFWGNDKFFFLDDEGYMYMYDSSTLETKPLQIYVGPVHMYTYFRTIMYEESLLSVKGRIEPLVPACISK